MEEIASVIKNKFLPESRRVLEIGCGSCSLLKELSNTYPDIYFCGIDPYISSLEEKNLCLRPEYAENIDAIPGWFDLIFSIHSFHHFSEPTTFLRKAGLKLSSKGQLLIFDWRKGARTGIPENYFSLEEMKGFLSGAGLKIEEDTTQGDNLLIVASRESFMVAVATDDGINVTTHMFGRAEYFYVYRIQDRKIKLQEKRKNIYKDSFQHLKTFDVYSLVEDCSTIITGKIGKKGEKRLTDIGVDVIKYAGTIEDALNVIRA